VISSYEGRSPLITEGAPPSIPAAMRLRESISLLDSYDCREYTIRKRISLNVTKITIRDFTHWDNSTKVLIIQPNRHQNAKFFQRDGISKFSTVVSIHKD
jgi:hypothetical protein